MPPPAELGGSQISSLLEALPGIASVLRSPVADALVKAIRGAAGLGEFTVDDAEELIRYAVRRGLIGPEEGDRVLSDIQGALKRKPPRPPHPGPNRPPKRSPPGKRSRAGESAAALPPAVRDRGRRVRADDTTGVRHARHPERSLPPRERARGGGALRHGRGGGRGRATARAHRRSGTARARCVPGAGGALRRRHRDL